MPTITMLLQNSGVDVFSRESTPSSSTQLRMKNEDPPFDPPYVSIHHAEDGVTYTKTLTDGSARPVSAAEADWMQAGESVSGKAQSPKSAQPSKSGSKAHSQGKVFLNVPFAEKDAAKGLGARWDATRKKWYVPQGVDVDQFGRWMPDGGRLNGRPLSDIN